MKAPEAESKIDFRKRLKSRLKKNSFEVQQNEFLAKNLIELLHSHLNYFPNDNDPLGAFAPILNEPNVLAYLKDEDSDGHLCFPSFVEEGKMVFRKSTVNDLIEDQNFGVKMMSPSLQNKIVTPKVVLIPGLGFTEKGARLGRGKGFYDRYLYKYNGIKIGLGFELQMEKKLPTDKYDQLMDFIVTEKRIIQCSFGNKRTKGE